MIRLPGNNVEQVFDSYCEYLALTFGNPSAQLKRFIDRFKADPEPPRAEAVVFTWLSNIGMNPQLNEDPARGGMDSLCSPPSGNRFFVEVTSISAKALAADTGLPVTLGHLRGGAFGIPTPLLQERIKKKMEQMSNAQLPRVLAICSEHPMVDVVFGATAAQYLFTSTPLITVPLDTSIQAYEATTLQNSAFFKPDEQRPGVIVPARQAASAVLLVPILVHGIRPVGLLHPQPAIPLPLDDWYQTPFIKVRDWPIKDGKLSVEWTLPYGDPFYVHQRLRLVKPKPETKPRLK